MPKKKKVTSHIDVYCRNCGTEFNAILRGSSITCQGLRQHIQKSAECRQSYDDEGLISRGNNIDLQTSIKAHQKRNADCDPINEPPPKRVLLTELNVTYLQDHFGILPTSNTLEKGQSFANKAILVRTRTFSIPGTKQLNDLLCHGGTFDNHISSKAIILNPKMEQLADTKEILSMEPPKEITVLVDDSSSIISSVALEGVMRQSDSVISPTHDQQHLDADDELSVESDNDLDGGSLRGNDTDSDESTHCMGNVAHDAVPNGHNPTQDRARNLTGKEIQIIGDAPVVTTAPVTPAFEPPRLLERWMQQRDNTTIRPGIAPDPFVISELGLLHLQHKHRFSLQAVEDIKKWAFDSCRRYPRIFDVRPATRKKQLKMIRQAMGITHDDSFQEVAINWLPQNKPRGIQVRSIYDPLFYELLSNEELCGDGGCNFSFPSATNPFALYPEAMPEFATELHHGWWYAETAKEVCTGPNDILVPVIAYTDGVATDSNGRLPVTPFNITLGIFNLATRRRADAWTTILLIPDEDSEASVQKGTKTFHKLQNLHNCIRVAFRELKELMDGNHGIPWQIQYGGKTWEVNLKFAMAYVIGDTEMHDKLCGRYGSRTGGISSICRHCNVPTHQLAEGGSTFEDSLFYCPEALDPRAHSREYFKSISHHPIQNAFHGLYFGANKYNIHLGSPGELLHMLQKGTCVRVIEGFVHMWSDPTVEQDSITAVNNNQRCNILLEEMDLLGKKYGGYLSRQSDRDRPRTKFRSSLFVKTKKNGHEHGGVLMDLLCALISNRGRQILAERDVDERWIENYVYLIELLLQFEHFMKLTSIPIKYLLDERRLGSAVDHLLYILDNTIHREEGTMGNNTAKNHLILHIPHYASRWGPPTGMDSGDNERNHKTEVKPQSKWTQRREYNFQAQFGSRWHETRLVSRAANRFRRIHDLSGPLASIAEDLDLSQDGSPVEDTTIQLDGSHLDFGIRADGLPTMGWTDPEKRGRTALPQPVVDFVCLNVLNRVTANTIHGRTEAKVFINGNRETFRCHPNYRSDSNQRIHVWYDWAIFKFEAQSGRSLKLPAQIAAIIEIGDLTELPDGRSHKVRSLELKSKTNYAVVRLFKQEPRFFRKSTLKGFWYTNSVKWGQVRDGFYLLPIDSILSTAIVVPNVEEDPSCKGRAVEPLDGGFFVFPSREKLGQDFMECIDRCQQGLEGLSDIEESDDSGRDSGNVSDGSHDDSTSSGSGTNESYSGSSDSRTEGSDSSGDDHHSDGDTSSDTDDGDTSDEESDDGSTVHIMDSCQRLDYLTEYISKLNL